MDLNNKEVPRTFPGWSFDTTKEMKIANSFHLIFHLKISEQISRDMNVALVLSKLQKGSVEESSSLMMMIMDPLLLEIGEVLR